MNFKAIVLAAAFVGASQARAEHPAFFEYANKMVRCSWDANTCRNMKAVDLQILQAASTDVAAGLKGIADKIELRLAPVAAKVQELRALSADSKNKENYVLVEKAIADKTKTASEQVASLRRLERELPGAVMKLAEAVVNGPADSLAIHDLLRTKAFENDIKMIFNANETVTEGMASADSKDELVTYLRLDSFLDYCLEGSTGLDPQAIARLIGRGDEKPLSVTCEKAGFLGKPSAKADPANRAVRIKYTVKKWHSGGMFDSNTHYSNEYPDSKDVKAAIEAVLGQGN